MNLILRHDVNIVEFVGQKYAYLYTILISYIGYSTAQVKDLPFCLQQACVLLLFLHVGYYFNKLGILNKRLDLTFGLFAGLSALYCFKKEAMHISAVVIPGGIMNIIWTIAATYILMKVFEKKEGKILAFLGKNSLTILCVHAVWCYAKNWKHLTESLWINILIEILIPIIGMFVLKGI